MKNPFKVGDKVAIYDGGMRIVGTISRINNSDTVMLELYSSKEHFHWKQCRRLKKKERRVVWVAEDKSGNIHPSFWQATSDMPTALRNWHFKRWVRFVECSETTSKKLVECKEKGE